MKCSMDTPFLIEMHEDGTPCSNVMDFDGAPQRLTKVPRKTAPGLWIPPTGRGCDLPS